jgi:hypothetical protein
MLNAAALWLRRIPADAYIIAFGQGNAVIKAQGILEGE